MLPPRVQGARIRRTRVAGGKDRFALENRPQSGPSDGLLSERDCAPVWAARLDRPGPFLLLCEHAGNAVPASLDNLGLPAVELERHIGWDIGAAGVTRALGERLDAPVLLQRYSRLVIDCNRPRHNPALVPAQSDGTEITANRDLSAAEVEARWNAIHRPFHDLASERLDRWPGSMLVTVHSFTPRLRSDPDQLRPMHIGLLHQADDRLAKAVAAGLKAADPALPLAFNAPYSIDEDSDYAIPVHGVCRGIPNLLIEIRQDLIATPKDQSLWAQRLHHALTAPAVARLTKDLSA